MGAKEMRMIRTLLKDLNMKPGSKGHTAMVKDFLKLSGLEHMIPTLYPKKTCCGCNTKCNIACATAVACVAGTAAISLILLGHYEMPAEVTYEFWYAMPYEITPTMVNPAGGVMAGVSAFSLAAILLLM